MVKNLFKISSIRKTLGSMWSIRSQFPNERKIISPDVFVSYSWKDSDLVVPFVESLIEFLSPKGIQIFFDRDSRPLYDPGTLNIGLASGLSTARIFLPCPSWNYLDSRWCYKELSAFLWRYISEDMTVAENNKNTRPRLAASLALYCLPVVLDCDDSFEAIHEFEKLELALLKEVHDKSVDIEIIRKFLSSSKKLVFRDGRKPKDLARLVGTLIEELLEFSSQARRELNANELWKVLWTLYDYSAMGERVNPIALLTDFTIKPDVIKKAKSEIEKYADEGLVKLFFSVAKGRSKCVAFDRWNSILSAVENSDHLNATSMVGDPIILLVSQLRNHPMLQEIQYSYYSFISQYGQDPLTDVCALACLSMNMHSWFEGVRDAEDMRENILTPLFEGANISNYISC